MAPRKSKPVRTTRAVNSISNNLIASPSLSSFSSSASAASHYIASSPTPSLTHSSWSISSDDAPGIIFSLGFAAVPSHDLKSSSSSSSSIVTPHTSINTTTTTTANNALALKISTNTTTLSNTSPCTPPSTAPCSPSHSSRSKSDLAVSFTPYRPTTPSTDVDSPPLPTNTTAAATTTTTSTTSTSPSTKMMMMNRRFSLPALPHPLHRKNHRSSMTTMNSGVNLSVKIHGIFDSELLAARLLGPGSRRALLRSSEDGSVLLPSQINNVKASSSSSARQAQKTSSSLTNNSNNTSINPSSTTASTTTSTTIAKPKPSLSTIISSTTAPTTNKRSSSSISTDDENPIPNPKRRRHSAPEVSHPRPTVSPSPPPHQTNPGSGVGVCQFCSVRKTGQWRRGPAGQRTLCNACGINWSKKVKAEALRRGCSVAEAERIVGSDEKRFRKVVINVLSEVDEGMEEADEMESGME